MIPLSTKIPIDKLTEQGEYYFTDGKNIFFNDLYEDKLVKNADIDSFMFIYYFAKDNNNCYMLGNKLRNADVNSFQVLNYAYAIDKNNVYTIVGRIPGANIVSFVVLDDGKDDSDYPFGYAKDKNHVYFNNGDGKVKIIKSADVESFVSLNNGMFAKDKTRIYAYGRALPKVDIDSWEELGNYYSIDSQRVYYVNRQIKSADRDSFEVMGRQNGGPNLAKDCYHNYENDKIVDNESDGANR